MCLGGLVRLGLVLVHGAGGASLPVHGVLFFSGRERMLGTGVCLQWCDLEEKPTSPLLFMATAFFLPWVGAS